MLTFDAVLCRLRRAVRRFPAASRANVAITFGLALVPIMGLTGAAVDFSHANSVKADMQAALDSTALMISKNAANMSAAQIQTAADGYFQALFTRPEATNIKVTTNYANNGGSTMVVTGSADMATDFMGVIGYKSITVTSSATAKWGSTRLRVALVLDNTGSMAQSGKIGALKTATTNLLTQLQNAVTNDGDVYVSIVPFSKNVSVDVANNVNANWIDWADWSAPPPNSTPGSSVGPGSNCPYSTSNNGFQCTTGPANGSATTSKVPSSGTYAGYICPSIDNGNKNSLQGSIYYNGCYNSVGTTTTTTTTVGSGSNASCNGYSNCTCTGGGSSKVCKQTTTTTGAPYTHTWVANATSTWNGCITDRGTSSAPSASNYDRTIAAPVEGDASSLYPAQQYSYCTLETMGLSYNWASMTTLVNQMSPNGSTNQPIGLVWGWQTLAGGGPFSVPAEDPNFQYKKVIILLTDGLNTQDRWFGNGSATSTQVDYRMYDANGNGTCANIKAAGITIYTIQVNTGGDPTSTLLQNCATDSTKFFLLTSANQIVTTFNQIGTNLTQLRIAQ
jgi:Flp pilus assembly protein TadG